MATEITFGRGMLTRTSPKGLPFRMVACALLVLYVELVRVVQFGSVARLYRRRRAQSRCQERLKFKRQFGQFCRDKLSLGTVRRWSPRYCKLPVGGGWIIRRRKYLTRVQSIVQYCSSEIRIRSSVIPIPKLRSLRYWSRFMPLPCPPFIFK